MRYYTTLACVLLLLTAAPSHATTFDLQIDYIVQSVSVPTEIEGYQELRNLQTNDAIRLNLLFDSDSAALSAQGSVGGFGEWSEYNIDPIIGARMTLGDASFRLAPDDTRMTIGNDSGPNQIDYFGLKFSGITPAEWSPTPGLLSIENLFRDIDPNQMFSDDDLEQIQFLNMAAIDQAFIDFSIVFASAFESQNYIYIDADLADVNVKRIPEPLTGILLLSGLAVPLALKARRRPR